LPSASHFAGCMKAPPISEATFMVETACSVIVDPESGTLGCALLAAELTCARESEADKAAAGSKTNPVQNDLISR
jgi:hypothetical protein